VDELTFDYEQVCPYLHDRISRLPLRMQTAMVDGPRFDQHLAEGDRRTGRYLYRTECPNCRECEPIRIRVERFQPTRSQRRVWKRGEQKVSTSVAAPFADEQRVRIFNAHRNGRGMNPSGSSFGVLDYESFLNDSCCDTIALDYFVEDQLAGVAICDRGEKAWSAVYCFFDPEFSNLSLGTYSILKQISLCQEQGITWLYLGYFIQNCSHMRYKDAYRPHERLLNGVWTLFDPAT
jgi:arginyl-tRNA--protein-N-Asp/Glu arginylyltransferase